MVSLSDPQSLGDVKSSRSGVGGNNSFKWWMAIPKKVRYIVSVVVAVVLAFAIILAGVEVYKKSYISRGFHATVEWGSGLFAKNKPSEKLATNTQKDEFDGMPPAGAAPDLDQAPSASSKALTAKAAEPSGQIRRPPPGSAESRKTAPPPVVATLAPPPVVAKPASTPVPPLSVQKPAAQAQVQAQASAASDGAVSSTMQSGDLATLKKDVAEIKEWKEAQSKVTLTLAERVAKVEETTASDKITKMAANITRLEGQQRATNALAKKTEAHLLSKEGDWSQIAEALRSGKLRQTANADLQAKVDQSAEEIAGSASSSAVVSTAGPVVSRNLPNSTCIARCPKKK